MPTHLDTGRAGEDLAAAWYRRHGYRLLARNWRCSIGELDIVARRGSTVVVAEVKTRRSDAFGSAAAAVGPVKQQRIRRLTAEWLAVTGVRGVEIRFDVVAITGRRLEVIPGAF